jgi:hypothetical protein
MESTATWFPWFFGASLVVVFVATLILQSRTKWRILRRIRRWPGVLDALGRLWAVVEFRRLRTTSGDRLAEQPPPDDAG